MSAISDLQTAVNQTLDRIRDLSKDIAIETTTVQRLVRDSSLTRIQRGGRRNVVLDFSGSTDALQDGIDRMGVVADRYEELLRRIKEAELIKIIPKSGIERPPGKPPTATIYVLGYAFPKVAQGDSRRYPRISFYEFEFDPGEPDEIEILKSYQYYIDDVDAIDETGITPLAFARNTHELVVAQQSDELMVFYQIPAEMPEPLDPNVIEPVSFTKLIQKDFRPEAKTPLVELAPLIPKYANWLVEEDDGGGFDKSIDAVNSSGVGRWSSWDTDTGAESFRVDSTATANEILDILPAPEATATFNYLYRDLTGSLVWDAWSTERFNVVQPGSSIRWEEQDLTAPPSTRYYAVFQLTPLPLGEFRYQLDIQLAGGLFQDSYSYDSDDIDDPVVPFGDPVLGPFEKINFDEAERLRNNLGSVIIAESNRTFWRSGATLEPESPKTENVPVNTWTNFEPAIELKTDAEKAGCPGGSIGGDLGDSETWDYHFGWINPLAGLVLSAPGLSGPYTRTFDATIDVRDSITATVGSLIEDNYTNRLPVEGGSVRVEPFISEKTRDNKESSTTGGVPEHGPYTASDLGDGDCGCIGTQTCDHQQSWAAAFEQEDPPNEDIWGEVAIAKDILGAVLLDNHEIASDSFVTMNIGASKVIGVASPTRQGKGQTFLTNEISIFRFEGGMDTGAILYDDLTPALRAPSPHIRRIFQNSARGLVEVDTPSGGIGLVWLRDVNTVDSGDIVLESHLEVFGVKVRLVSLELVGGATPIIDVVDA